MRRHRWRVPLAHRWALLSGDVKVSGYLLLWLSLSLLVAWAVWHLAWPDAKAERAVLLLPLALLASQPMFVWFCQCSWALDLPRWLPRMNLHGVIPEDCRTVVAIPALLSDAHTIDRLIADLERRYLDNQSKNLLFCLLSDFADAPTQHQHGDQELLASAQRGMRRLLDTHGEHFCLLHRSRTYNSTDQCWMGYERKRGKIMALNNYICGGGLADFSVWAGNIDFLDRCKYAIVLDADMQLPPGAALALIQVAAHPLNWPLLDPAIGRVVAGYGLLQPGIYQIPASQQPSPYEHLHTAIGRHEDGTLQPDLYQDLFGESAVYWGKGIYDVRAFHECTRARFADNTVLSHDLLESCYVRCGFVGDIQLPEQFPSSYIASAVRKHRWVRGDWGLLRWLRAHIPLADGRRYSATRLTCWDDGG